MYKGSLLLSLHQIYISLSDPTEYRIATEYLGGWDHWQTLSALEWFKDYRDKWRTELELKLTADAFQIILSASKAETKESLTAAKFIQEKKYKGSGRGRPSKGERAQLLLETESAKQTLLRDAERIGLSIVKTLPTPQVK
jgi:hypothetical protein